MAKIRATEALRRYTDLPALLYLLKHRKITLLDPATWDDTNDSYYLLKYKEKKNLKTLLALCLTEAEETHHHWRVFSHGPAGICISFHRANLIRALQAVPGVTVKGVSYRKVREAQKQIKPPSLGDLPFSKRYAFVAEEEIRAVFESDVKPLKFLDIDFDLGSILRITLSPWINDRLKTAVKEAIHAIPGCVHLDVRRSTLIGNAEWKKLGDEAV